MGNMFFPLRVAPMRIEKNYIKGIKSRNVSLLKSPNLMMNV